MKGAPVGRQPCELQLVSRSLFLSAVKFYCVVEQKYHKWYDIL